MKSAGRDTMILDWNKFLCSSMSRYRCANHGASRITPDNVNFIMNAPSRLSLGVVRAGNKFTTPDFAEQVLSLYRKNKKDIVNIYDVIVANYTNTWMKKNAKDDKKLVEAAIKSLLPQPRKLLHIVLSLIVEIYPKLNERWTKLQFSRTPLIFGLDCTQKIVDDTVWCRYKHAYISLQTISDDLGMIALLHLANCKSESHSEWITSIAQIKAFQWKWSDISILMQN